MFSSSPTKAGPNYSTSLTTIPLPLSPNLLLRKCSCLPLQHTHNLLMRHTYLLSYRHQASCQRIIIFSHQSIRNHEIIDIMKNQGATILVLFLGFHECDRMVAPMTARVEVVRCVPAVVEAISVTLAEEVRECIVWIGEKEEELTGTSMRVILERKSESGSISSTKACWPKLPIIIPIRICINGMIKTKRVGRKL
jgi:hypothetical protein